MLETLLAALNALYPTAVYGWENQSADSYCVIGEDSAQSIWADGKMQEQSTQGTIDLFTKVPYGAAKLAVQEVLAGIDGLSWYLNSAQYEDDTGYIHYEWVWEVA